MRYTITFTYDTNLQTAADADFNVVMQFNQSLIPRGESRILIMVLQMVMSQFYGEQLIRPKKIPTLITLWAARASITLRNRLIAILGLTASFYLQSISTNMTSGVISQRVPKASLIRSSTQENNSTVKLDYTI